MRAVVYCRVSTQEQIQGYSLDKQEEECINLIKKSGYQFVESYVDDGYSAKDTNRPALQRMLGEMSKHAYDMIVVWSTDRLTRDIIDGLSMVKNMFNRNGIKFASVTEDIDTSSYDGMMMLTMRLMMAQRERERNAERVSMGQAKKASMGRRVSLGKIYGYETVEGKLVPNENEVPVVNRIFEYYVFKGWGYGRIAAALNSEKIPAKKTLWQPVTIKGILKNITYIGKNSWTPKNGQTVINDGEHEGIITEELFMLAQTQLKRRFSGEMSRSSYNYPFSTIIKCGACGDSYNAYNKVRRRNDTKEYTNYRCSNRKAGICQASDIAEVKFEKLFFEFFNKEHKITEKYTPDPTPEEIRSTEKEKSRITREINKLEKRKNNLLDDLGDKIISREDYKGKVDEINQSLSKLRNEMEIIEPPEVAVTRSPDEVFDFMRRLETDWKFMNNEDRKFIIQSFFKSIVIKKENDTWSIKEVDSA
jgi:site-specific DNA recombinase